MSEYGLPVLFALFVWWFSTGLIVYLDGLPRSTFRWSMAGATVLLVAALYGLFAIRSDTSLFSAYVAFTCGLMVWGWIEMSFLMGYVTGPRRKACAANCSGWKHFIHGVQALLYHELAIIAGALILTAITWGADNQLGLWTFLVLWLMRQSTKLNIFLGVRNVTEEFLPDHLTYLKSFFRIRPMNPLFPVSVTLSTLLFVMLIIEAAGANGNGFNAAGMTFLATLMGLAILEHWFLVLPIPASALWSWALRSHTSTGAPFDTNLAPGVWGVGKPNWRR